VNILALVCSLALAPVDSYAPILHPEQHIDGLMSAYFRGGAVEHKASDHGFVSLSLVMNDYYQDEFIVPAWSRFDVTIPVAGRPAGRFSLHASRWKDEMGVHNRTEYRSNLLIWANGETTDVTNKRGKWWLATRRHLAAIDAAKVENDRAVATRPERVMESWGGE
jgi:hypothetical protein